MQVSLDLRSNLYYTKQVNSRRCGGIGRHTGFKILRRQLRVGSSPTSGTKNAYLFQDMRSFLPYFIKSKLDNSNLASLHCI